MAVTDNAGSAPLDEPTCAYQQPASYEAKWNLAPGEKCLLQKDPSSLCRFPLCFLLIPRVLFISVTPPFPRRSLSPCALNRCTCMLHDVAWASGRKAPRLCLSSFALVVIAALLSLSFARSGESEPGDGQRVGGGGRDGHHQLSGEEQRRLCYPAAQPQPADHLLQRRET